jgi:hypothetical protein
MDHMWKPWVFLGVFLCAFLAHADGEGYHIQPWCPVQGPVYLEVRDLQAQGFVGLDVMTLSYVEGRLVGTFRNEEIDLAVYRSGDIRGHIGSYPAIWHLNQRGNVIYGLQTCQIGPFTE